jgi:hypothetical protein
LNFEEKKISWIVRKIKKPVNKGFEGFEVFLILLLAERVGVAPAPQMCY